MDASGNMKAVQIMCQHKGLGQILLPLLNIERDEIDWKRISYGALPGGFQAALSWAYAMFCDEVPPADWDYRDPFSSFGVMDRDLQTLAFEALASRHGFVKVTLEDKPPSPFVKMLEKMEADYVKEEKRKNLKLIDDE